MSHDAAERLVAGRWTLHTALRRGPAGVIWQATDADGRRLAVEELRLPTRPDPGDTDQAALWGRVAAEARAAASLDHPALVRLDDVVVDDGVVYVASELVDALPLNELVARNGPLPPRRAAELGLELLDTLEAAHGAGLPHLDLRPANVLVAADGHVRLAGLGLTTLRTAPGADRATIAFLAPEQVRGDTPGPAADLWALGAILYLAVEGDPPFGPDGAEATLEAILRDRPRPPERAGPLAPTLTALLTKPAGGRPNITDTRRLLAPVAGRSVPRAGPPSSGQGEGVGPGPPMAPEVGHPPQPVPAPPVAPDVPNPPDPVSGPPEGKLAHGRICRSRVSTAPRRGRICPRPLSIAPLRIWRRPASPTLSLVCGRPGSTALRLGRGRCGTRWTRWCGRCCWSPAVRSCWRWSPSWLSWP